MYDTQFFISKQVYVQIPVLNCIENLSSGLIPKGRGTGISQRRTILDNHYLWSVTFFAAKELQASKNCIRPFTLNLKTMNCFSDFLLLTTKSIILESLCLSSAFAAWKMILVTEFRLSSQSSYPPAVSVLAARYMLREWCHWMSNVWSAPLHGILSFIHTV